MSEKSLPDELRSVLLAHSLDAPDPDDTVTRTLAETIDAATLQSMTRRRWRPSAGLMSGVAAAAVCVAVVGGFVALSRDNQDAKSSSNSAQDFGAANGSAGSLSAGSSLPYAQAGPNIERSAQASFSPKEDFFVPSTLSCPTSSGGSSTTFSFGQTVDVGGETDTIVSAQCRTATGEQSASEVYTSKGTGSGGAQIRAWIIKQSDGLAVDSITTAPMQITVRFLRLGTARTPATLEQRTYLTDNGVSYHVSSSAILAQACDPTELDTSVVSGGDGSAAILRVRNTGVDSCVLSGYPKIAGATRVVDGSGDGVPADAAPIVELRSGRIASAEVDQPLHSVPCPSGSMHPEVALPDGNRLDGVDWATTVNCQPLVHPFVAGATGTN